MYVFTVPFCDAISTLYTMFFTKHFPSSDGCFLSTNPLHKVFNRNNVKVSYSCMENIKSTISNHNHELVSNDLAASAQCNCKNEKECPLDGKCLVKNIVYKAEITSQNGTVKTYIGMTSNSFKERYRNHLKSFNHRQYSSETELKLKLYQNMCGI